ncbi:uncharacterized protein [Nicotiana sylvestris]|uniref:uncharacterized protein n=1 Tax=Nicotiana sylvestris TaxID=4096 RepID=UPI00388C957F
MAVDEVADQSSIVIDRNHPLYLYLSDIPGALSLGFQLIGIENYTMWSQAMEVSLLTRNKLGFIDGTINRDTYGDNCDLLCGVLFRSNACAIWADLREHFDKVNASRMYYLHREIFTLTQGMTSVSVYYSKLKDLWDEYDSIMPPPTYPTALYSSKLRQKMKKNYNLECDYCNMKGHTRDNGYKLLRCEYYNIKGHLKTNYYKLNGYPADFKPKRKANMTSSVPS